MLHLSFVYNAIIIISGIIIIISNNAKLRCAEKEVD
jgi:hypothetical protein